jgi:hypothetical protein
MTSLDASQWNKRMSILIHWSLREYGTDREEEIVDMAFRTLELLCVGDEAKQSLEVTWPHSEPCDCVLAF